MSPATTLTNTSTPFMNKRNRILFALTLAAFAAATLVVSTAIADDPVQLPWPDGKPADQTKPVKVFIMLGQSNNAGLWPSRAEGDEGFAGIHGQGEG